MNSTTRVIDLQDYVERKFPVYTIQEHGEIPTRLNELLLRNTLKSLLPGQSFVVDNSQHLVSNWAMKWAKKLNRKFMTKKLSHSSTEVYRVV